MPQQRQSPKSADEEAPEEQNLTRMEGTAGLLSGVVPEDAEQIMAMQDVPREDDAVPVAKNLEPVVLGPPAYGSPDPQTLAYGLLTGPEEQPGPSEEEEGGGEEPMQAKAPERSSSSSEKK
jgi:hypothetical protein